MGKKKISFCFASVLLLFLPRILTAQSDFTGTWKGSIIDGSGKSIGACEITIGKNSDTKNVPVLLKISENNQAAVDQQLTGTIGQYSDTRQHYLSVQQVIKKGSKKYEGVMILGLKKTDADQNQLSGHFVGKDDKNDLSYFWLFEPLTVAGVAKENPVAKVAAASPAKTTAFPKPVLGKGPGNIAADAVTLDVDKILAIRGTSIWVRKGDKDALMDLKGNFIIPWGKYRLSMWAQNALKYGFFEVSDGKNNTCFLNKEGQPVICQNYSDIQFNSDYGLFFTVPFRGVQKVFTAKGVELKWLSDLYTRSNSSAIKYSVIGGSVSDGYHLYDQERILINRTVTDTLSYSEGKKLPGVVSTQIIGPNKAKISRTSWAYFTLSGKEIIPFRPYKEARPFHDGMAAVCMVDEFNIPKWGFINREGETVIPFMFTKEPGAFNAGLARVEPATKTDFDYAYIDKKGTVKHKMRRNTIIGTPGELSFSKHFFGGKLLLTSGDEKNYFVMDTAGNIVNFKDVIRPYNFENKDESRPRIVGCGPNYISFFIRNENDRYILSNNEYGLMNYDGSVRVPPYFALTFDPNIAPDPLNEYSIAFVETGVNTYTHGVINKDGVYVVIIGAPSKW